MFYLSMNIFKRKSALARISSKIKWLVIVEEISKKHDTSIFELHLQMTHFDFLKKHIFSGGLWSEKKRSQPKTDTNRWLLSTKLPQQHLHISRNFDHFSDVKRPNWMWVFFTQQPRLSWRYWSLQKELEGENSGVCGIELWRLVKRFRKSFSPCFYQGNTTLDSKFPIRWFCSFFAPKSNISFLTEDWEPCKDVQKITLFYLKSFNIEEQITLFELRSWPLDFNKKRKLLFATTPAASL